MLAQSPERDRDIETIQTLFGNRAMYVEVTDQITANMSLSAYCAPHSPGSRDEKDAVWLHLYNPDRRRYRRQHFTTPMQTIPSQPAPPRPRALAVLPHVDAGCLPGNASLTFDRVIPVANYALHPRMASGFILPIHAARGLRGSTALHPPTVEEIRQRTYRFYRGLNFCQNRLPEMSPIQTVEIHDVIRYSGTREDQRINIRGHLKHPPVEVYP